MLKAYQSALKEIMDEYPEPYYWAGFYPHLQLIKIKETNGII